MSFEIWRQKMTGERYLVAVRGGKVNVAAGPFEENDDPRRVLETHSNQNHNPLALLDIRKEPQAYEREWISDESGRTIPAPNTSTDAL